MDMEEACRVLVYCRFLFFCAVTCVVGSPMQCGDVM